MALFHRHNNIDAVLVAVAWRRETIIEHGHEVTEHWVDTDGIPCTKVKTVWQEGRVVATSGDSQAGVRWAEFSLWPNERVRKQTETYTATFQAMDDSVDDADKAIEADLHESLWRTLTVSATYRLEFGVLGHVHHVTPVAG
jgi:hypothetical protein